MSDQCSAYCEMLWRILLSFVAQPSMIYVLLSYGVAGFGGTETFPSQISARRKSLGVRSGDVRGHFVHPLS